MKDFCVDPGGFPFAKGVESIEAYFEPLEEANCLDVINRHAILQSESRIIGPQGKTPHWRQTPKKNLHTAPGIGFIHVAGISARCAMQFTITNRDRVSHE